MDEQDTNAVVETGDSLDGFEEGLMGDIEPEQDTSAGGEQTPETAAEDTDTEGDTEPNEEGTEDSAEGEGKQEETPALPGLEIIHLGEKKQLTHDEAVTLAQKGMNYDHVSQKVARLEAELSRAGTTMPPVLEAYAKLVGGDVNSLLAQMQAKVAEAGIPISAPQQSNYFQEKAVSDWKDFLQAYPDIKDPQNELAKEVWDAINAGLTPRQAMIEYRSRDLEAQLAAKDQEIAELKKQQVIEKKNVENKKKATGPLGTAGNGGGDAFLTGLMGV